MLIDQPAIWLINRFAGLSIYCIYKSIRWNRCYNCALLFFPNFFILIKSLFVKWWTIWNNIFLKTILMKITSARSNKNVFMNSVMCCSNLYSCWQQTELYSTTFNLSYLNKVKAFISNNPQYKTFTLEHQNTIIHH